MKAQEILVVRDAAIVPVFHAWQTHLVSPRLVGYRANPINEIHLDEMSLKSP